MGLVNWTKLEHIDLLKQTLHTTPPQIPNAETTSSQILPTSEGNYFGYELARRSERLLAKIIESIILIIFILIVFFDSNGNIEPFYPGFIYCIAISSALLGAAIYLPIDFVESSVERYRISVRLS